LVRKEEGERIEERVKGERERGEKMRDEEGRG
jgi:hypothetical protein